MKTIHKFIILAILGCLFMYSFSGCSNSTTSSSTSTDQQTISASDYKIKFLGDVWSSVVFHHKEHADRFDDCYECHYCAGVEGESLWNCRSCHSPGNTEGLCQDDGTHGCIMAQCNYCHEDLERNTGLDCTDCHTQGALANTGHFVDSPVEGLDYQTTSISGITDEAGTFYFRDGETISFFIEDLLLGTASAKTDMTPLDLVAGATDVTNPTVTNICRLLMSLDVDGNPDNGITISDDIKDQLAGRSINFNQSTEDFGNDPDVLALLDTLNQLGIFTDNEDRTLCSPTEAQTHIAATLISLDTPPTATFSGGLQVSGSDTCTQCHAEAANINGLYNEAGTLNGKPKYTHETESFWIHWNTVDTNEWKLSSDTASQTYMYHYDVTNPGSGGDSPPLGAWGSGCTRDGKDATATLAAVGGINGNTWVGAELTSDYEYYDDEGDLESGSLYQWYRCDDDSGTNDVEISGATGAIYTLVDDDVGKYIRFEVIPAAASGNSPGDAVQSGAVGPVIDNPAPSATNVGISGDVWVTATLTGTYVYEDEMSDPESGSTYQWYRYDDASGTNETSISGATSATYTIAAEDEGKYLKFEVTPGAAAGDTPGTAVKSDAAGPVGPDPSNEVPTAGSVVISGTPNVNETLTGSYVYGDTEGDTESGTTFKWYRCDDSSGTNDVQISVATAATYTPVTADESKYLKFEVTPAAALGNSPGDPVQSDVFGPITPDPANQVPTASSVDFTGSLWVDGVLTGTYAYNDGEGDLESGTTFKWYRDGAVISGAVSQTYILVTADQGKLIKFEVTPAAATGNSPGSAVQSTAKGPIGANPGDAYPTADNVAVSGNLWVTETLTGTYDYNDAEGDLESGSTFKWYRDGVAISGATSITYTLVTPDQGKNIKFEVTPAAATGNSPGSPVQSSAYGPIGPDPTNQVPTASMPSGILIEKADLASLIGVYNQNGTLNGKPLYKHETNNYWIYYDLGTDEWDSWWNIDSDTNPDSCLFMSQIDSETPPYEWWERHWDNSGNGAAYVTPNNGISGDLWVGSTITATYYYNDQEGDQEGGSSYQWYRYDDESGTNEVLITGANSTSYTPANADEGKYLKFEVTPGAATGNTPGLPVKSAAVGPITRTTKYTGEIASASEVDHWAIHLDSTSNVIIDVQAFEACGNKPIPSDFFGDGHNNNQLYADFYLFTSTGTFIDKGGAGPGAHDTRTGRHPTYLSLNNLATGNYIIAIGSMQLSQADAWNGTNTDTANSQWKDEDWDGNPLTNYYNILVTISTH